MQEEYDRKFIDELSIHRAKLEEQFCDVLSIVSEVTSYADSIDEIYKLRK